MRYWHIATRRQDKTFHHNLCMLPDAICFKKMSKKEDRNRKKYLPFGKENKYNAITVTQTLSCISCIHTFLHNLFHILLQLYSDIKPIIYCQWNIEIWYLFSRTFLFSRLNVEHDHNPCNLQLWPIIPVTQQQMQ